jgi:hypothetical protein
VNVVVDFVLLSVERKGRENDERRNEENTMREEKGGREAQTYSTVERTM